MEIKKVVSLGEIEVELLMNSGKLLRAISDGLADGSIDELSTETTNLLNALQDVLDAVRNLNKYE